MNLRYAIVAAVIAFTPVASFAQDPTDDFRIHGYSELSLTARLAEAGIDAQRVEEWGQAIRVDVLNEDGSRAVVLVNKDTLRPLNAGTAVATRLDVGNTGSGWNDDNFNSSTESLVETD